MKKGVAGIRVTEQYIKNVVYLALVDRVSVDILVHMCYFEIFLSLFAILSLESITFTCSSNSFL
jgi:hypothetical protein